MGAVTYNGHFGWWSDDGGPPEYGMSWARSTPAGHAFINFSRGRADDLATHAANAADLNGWKSNMTGGELAWLNGQPIQAQESIFQAAKTYHQLVL